MKSGVDKEEAHLCEVPSQVRMQAIVRNSCRPHSFYLFLQNLNTFKSVIILHLNMKFKVEAYLGFLGEERYRLQQDDSWRQIGSVLTRNGNGFDPYDGLQSTDKLFDVLEETKIYVCRTGELYFGDRMCTVNPTSRTMGEKDIADIQPKIYRETKPNQFNRDEMRSVIARGDDSNVNALVLDLEGHFQLVDSSEAQRRLAPYGVRHESFAPFNDYVGPEAVKDGEFIRETYFAMLEEWIVHLHNDELDNYTDGRTEQKSEAELWKEVEMLTKHLK